MTTTIGTTDDCLIRKNPIPHPTIFWFAIQELLGAR